MKPNEIVPPRHYKRDEGQLECFEAFRQMFGNQAALHACMFNATKYIFRHDKKGCTHQAAITDLDKAMVIFKKSSHGLTNGAAAFGRSENNTAYLAWSAEL